MPRKLRSCIVCGNLSRNPKFCSRSCSASHNNNLRHRNNRKPKVRLCQRCGKEIGYRCYGRKYCDDCNPNFVNQSKYTIADIKSRYSRLEAHAKIRCWSRAIFKKSGKELRCKICGYTNHVEVCHIKPISKFPDTTLLSVVNHIDNLVPLCPNHHWEFDHKLITLGSEEVFKQAS